MKKPKCTLVGEDGNIFNLVGIASKTLKNFGQEEQATVMTERVFNAKNYSEALNIIMEYVEAQ